MIPRCALLLSLALMTPPLAAEPRSISGIYPHLAMFNDENECGTGAVVPWAGRLWVVTYAPHAPKGSSDKLYEITPGLEQIIRPESIGGTPANRMIHPESKQLFIGPYVVDELGKVRTVPPANMFGRLTGMARHIKDPAGKVVYATMEEGIYEVDVRSLAVTELWADEQRNEGRHSELPGYHGKGFYSAQGRYIYANNGDHAPEALTEPATPSGVLAEWDGMADEWTVVKRKQFTDVTGPGGIEGGKPGDPVWTIGWDRRSLILMMRDRDAWQTFRLPKASHSYDGAHGWNTEWPRIRDIGEKDNLLMTMHGTFWRFPRDFSSGKTGGLVPVSNFLKVAGDFCRWQDRIVIGCDDTAKSEFLNKHRLKGNLAGPGQSQSNLWFLQPGQLSSLGPVIGRGAVWLDEWVVKDALSDPFLFTGYRYKTLCLTAESTSDSRFPVITLEVDRDGDGAWQELQHVTMDGSVWLDLSEHHARWIRLKSDDNLMFATAVFQFRNEDTRTAEASSIFDGLGTGNTTRGVLHARGGGAKTLRFVTGGVAYDLDGELRLRRTDDAAGAEWTAKNAAIPASGIETDAASVFYRDEKGNRWRLPKGEVTEGARVAREICTERNLLNVAGSFYELPAENAGGFPKIRPVCTHNRAIWDYAGYRGLLVMSGVADNAGGGHIIRSDDGKTALWAGAVDDLWNFGKPRGTGGPWRDSTVKAKLPSDPYLCTGYDKKRLTLSGDAPALVRLEADFTGTGLWSTVTWFRIRPGTPVEYRFPEAFSAYWVRLVSDRDVKATATFTWE